MKSSKRNFPQIFGWPFGFPTYVIGPLFVLCIWQIASSTGMAGSKFVPPPTTLLNTWANWIVGIGEKDQYTGSWLSHAIDSLYRVLIGVTIAAACGVTLGVTIGWFRLAAKLIDPVVQILRPTSITAWVPLAVVFFGIRNGSALFLIALGAFFPIVVNTAAGVQRTPLLLVRAARMPGIWPYMLLPRVVLPAFAGLRIGIGYRL